jgi:hypothetical protein
MTHGLLTSGVTSTGAATKLQIGSDLTLPAGGPWTIHHVWCQIAQPTRVNDQGSGGYFVVDAKSGDLDPDPAPGKYPMIGISVSDGANGQQTAMPLNLWPVNWQAAGKAVISLYAVNLLAQTTAAKAVAGILFGDGIPEKLPLKFCDSVSSSFASTAEQSLGSITLSEKATRIVGVLANLMKGDALTAAETVIGHIRLASNDVNLAPAQFPCAFAFNSGDGTPAGGCSQPQAQFIPVDIPVIGGSIVSVYGTTIESVTGNADLEVFLAYE